MSSPRHKIHEINRDRALTRQLKILCITESAQGRSKLHKHILVYKWKTGLFSLTYLYKHTNKPNKESTLTCCFVSDCQWLTGQMSVRKYIFGEDYTQKHRQAFYYFCIYPNASILFRILRSRELAICLHLASICENTSHFFHKGQRGVLWDGE